MPPDCSWPCALTRFSMSWQTYGCRWVWNESRTVDDARRSCGARQLAVPGTVPADDEDGPAMPAVAPGAVCAGWPASVRMIHGRSTLAVSASCLAIGEPAV